MGLLHLFLSFFHRELSLSGTERTWDKIFHIYLVYARHCFSLRFTNSRAENLCQKRQRAAKETGKDSNRGEREREAEADILSQDVCVCVLCIVFLWQIAHVRDAILLPTYSPGSPLSPTRLLAVCPIARSSSLPDVQLNLKFLRNPTKHGAKI